MTKEQIVEYIKHTPHNTNPNVISAMVDSIVEADRDTRIVSFKGRIGHVVPEAGDYTPDMIGAASMDQLTQAVHLLTNYTDEEIANLINDAPGTMDTLKELGDLIGDNKDLINTLNEAIIKKLDVNKLEESIELALAEAKMSGKFDGANGSEWLTGDYDITALPKPYLTDDLNNYPEGSFINGSSTFGATANYVVKDGQIGIDETTGDSGYFSLTDSHNAQVKSAANNDEPITFIMDVMFNDEHEPPKNLNGDYQNLSQFAIFSGFGNFVMYNFITKAFEIRREKNGGWIQSVNFENSDALQSYPFEVVKGCWYNLSAEFHKDRIIVYLNNEKILSCEITNAIDFIIIYPQYCNVTLDNFKIYIGLHNSEARIGDYYLNNETGDYYKCISSDGWIHIGNLTGPIGETGIQGVRGATWFKTTLDLNYLNINEVPDARLGDFCINTNNGDYYHAEQINENENAWIKLGNLKGPQGNNGYTPIFTWENDGTTLNITTPEGTTSANLQGPQGATGLKGATWFTGTKVVKAGNNMSEVTEGIPGTIIGDLYLNTDTGDVFECKVKDGYLWNYICNIRGVAGEKGETPQKGIDYFTPSDIQEVVNQVIAQLPKAEEGTF